MSSEKRCSDTLGLLPEIHVARQTLTEVERQEFPVNCWLDLLPRFGETSIYRMRLGSLVSE